MLWIRSQDKQTLTQVDNITTLVEGVKIYTHTPNGYVLLGEYNKERALEVLDEIQKLLIKNFNYTDFTFYAMPEE